MDNFALQWMISNYTTAFSCRTGRIKNSGAPHFETLEWNAPVSMRITDFSRDKIFRQRRDISQRMHFSKALHATSMTVFASGREDLNNLSASIKLVCVSPCVETWASTIATAFSRTMSHAFVNLILRFFPSRCKTSLTLLSFTPTTILLWFSVVTSGHSGTGISVYVTVNYSNIYIALVIHHKVWSQQSRNQCVCVMERWDRTDETYLMSYAPPYFMSLIG